MQKNERTVWIKSAHQQISPGDRGTEGEKSKILKLGKNIALVEILLKKTLSSIRLFFFWATGDDDAL